MPINILQTYPLSLSSILSLASYLSLSPSSFFPPLLSAFFFRPFSKHLPACDGFIMAGALGHIFVADFLLNRRGDSLSTPPPPSQWGET